MATQGAVKVAPFGRSARAPRAAIACLSVGLFLALLVATAGGRAMPFLTVGPAVGYAHPLTTETVDVNLSDAPAFSPQFLTEPAGTTVSIYLTNLGNLTHTFSLSNESKFRFNASDSPQELNRSFANLTPLANVSVAPHHSAWANITLGNNTGFDSFEFVSLVPYQFQAGMWGLLNVSTTAPGLQLSDNTSAGYAFQPDELGVEPSQFPVNVEISVTNLGTLAHTFTLSPTANYTLTTIGYLAAHTPLVNLSLNGTGGQEVNGSFTIPAPGIYEFVCTQSGHFAQGMFGFLYAGVPVPPPPAAPSTAVVDSWVLAGSAALLGLGALLVAIAGFTGRFPRAPPRHDH